MNILAEITQPYLKKNVPALQVGDTVRVHQKIRDIDAKGRDRERIQIFEGIVISRKHGKGIEGTFTVRKIAAAGIGVERVFPLHSPNIVKIERIKSAKVKQSKLYFLRDLKSAAMRLSRETRQATVWEEKGAEAAMEAMKEEAAVAAAISAEEKEGDERAETQAEAAIATPARVAEPEIKPTPKLESQQAATDQVAK